MHKESGIVLTKIVFTSILGLRWCESHGLTVIDLIFGTDPGSLLWVCIDGFVALFAM